MFIPRVGYAGPEPAAGFIKGISYEFYTPAMQASQRPIFSRPAAGIRSPRKLDRVTISRADVLGACIA